MRFPLGVTILAAACCGYGAAADPTPDLHEYKTVATAVTTTVLDLSRAFRQPAHLGIYPETDDQGIRIAAIEPGTPAERAGLKVGDRIIAVNAQPTATLDALRVVVTALSEGDRAALTLSRDGKPLAIDMRLAGASRPLGGAARPVLGVQMMPHTGGGVRIESVRAGMPAERAGVRPGDIVTRIGSFEIANQERLLEVLGGFAPGDRVVVALKRDGREMTLECALTAEPSEGTSREQPLSDQPSLASWDMRRPGTWTKPLYRLAVIPIEFADQKFNEKIPQTEWDKALFSKGVFKNKNATGQAVYGSLNDYYQEISYGKFHITGKVFAPIAVSRKRAEYAASPNRFHMFVESLDALRARDGKDALDQFDGLFFLYAGDRVPTQRGGIFWPHRASFNYMGTRWPYFICNEGGERMASISVISHEFGHMLGLPDFYAKPEVPGAEGVGVWCTMSTGHGRDGKPLHFSAWCKEQLGWIKPCVIDPNVQQKLILAPIQGSARECYKVLLRPDGTEYLLLENRVRRGYDRDLPAEGLLIWRVVDGRPVLEESHGVTTTDGASRFLGAVPYPSPSNTAFTPYTTPSSRPVKLGGLPVHINHIRKLPDGRIIFLIGYEYL